MKVKMTTGREVYNPHAEVQAPVQHTAVANGNAEIAVAAVDNTSEGNCPKCRKAMGTAMITAGQVYYCPTCRVSTPISDCEG